jgi:hypothetical protein
MSVSFLVEDLLPGGLRGWGTRGPGNCLRSLRGLPGQSSWHRGPGLRDLQPRSPPHSADREDPLPSECLHGSGRGAVGTSHLTGGSPIRRKYSAKPPTERRLRSSSASSTPSPTSEDQEAPGNRGSTTPLVGKVFWVEIAGVSRAGRQASVLRRTIKLSLHKERQMRKLLWGLLLLVLLPAAGEALAPGTAYTATHLQLLETASLQGTIVESLPKGTPVEVRGCASGWCQVAHGTRTGFLREIALRTAPPVVRRGARGYMNSEGEWVPSPRHTRDNRPPAGASAQCRDGSFSFSRHRRGTCSHHGGVARWL